MINLLQKLWDEYVWVGDEISDALNDTDPWSILDEILSDTEAMKKLRQDLFDVGVKNIPGFKYEDPQT